MAQIIFNKASGVNDSVFGKSYAPIKAYIEQQVEAFEQESFIDKVFVQDETNDWAAKYGSETSLGDMSPVGENGAYPKTGFQEGYSKTIEPEEWKLSFEISQTMIEDAKMGKAKSKAYGLSLSYARTKEKFAASILNNSTSTSMKFGGKSFDISCADTKALFATDHPSKTGGTTAQSNLYGAAFSYDNLCLLEEKMHYFKDDDGNLLNIMPDTILIPSKSKILKSVLDAVGQDDGTPGTANHSFNYNFGRWKVIATPYLNNPSTVNDNIWFLIDSRWNEAAKGLVWLNRIPLNIKSYIDNNTDANVWNARCRYGAAPANWRFAAASWPNLSGASTLE
jgi:hypothetical protein